MIDLSSVDVEDLLTKLDLSNVRMTASGEEVSFSCFGGEHSHGDERPSAYMNVDTTAWMCHGCKRRGNAITIVMDVHQVSKPTAESSLREWYGIEFDEPMGGSMVIETENHFRAQMERVVPARVPRSWLNAVRIDWVTGVSEPYELYMIGRGFAPDVLADWDIGYDFVSDRITIPVYDVDEELVGIKGRDWTGQREPKYMIIGDRPNITNYGFSPYEASEVVFGLDRNRHCRRVVLVEGELNAIALSQMGVPRPVGTGMSYFSDRHADLIIREAEEVVVFYDHGTAGDQGTWGRTDAGGRYHAGIVAKLEDHVRLRIVQATEKDPADLLRDGEAHVALDLIEQAPSVFDLALSRLLV